MAELPTGAAPEITLPWLVRLRWYAVAGQAVAVATAVGIYGLRLPLAPVCALIGLLGASNVVLGVWAARARDGEGEGRGAPAALLPAVMVGDVLGLTGLLYLSGGPSNPFGMLYLVHVTLAAVVLGARWTWGITGLSAVAYALLFRYHVPLVEGGAHGAHAGHGGGDGLLSAHLQGMWVAFSTASVAIAWFVARLTAALSARTARLGEARRAAARAERLASLTTLAAGAAHELGTPLGTIAVVAREMERAAARQEGGEGLVADARLIRAEVDRCRGILDRISARAGESAGEAPEDVTAEALLQAVRGALPQGLAGRLRIEVEPGVGPLRVPPRATVQVLASLVRNGFDASPEGAEVRIAASREGDRVRLRVVDEGSGMDEAVRARAGEPFFTTKPPGRGMGLGLFLARTLAEGLGGTLRLETGPGRGTAATLELPASAGLKDPERRRRE
ncbi:ATP-binding protein [Myxococcota bacterium]|nr:ATP-binding protein [Myxococcota bacterium]